MFLNPQLDVDMTRIGCRVVQNEPCWLCSGCANHRACIHLEYYNKKRGIKKSAYKPRRGGKRDCKPGMTDLGLICTGTVCQGDPWKPVWQDGHQVCHNETYGKYDDEFNKAFEDIGNFFKNLPNVLKDAFSPNGPLAHLFDPNLNGIAQAVANANAAMRDAFDPEKNGVAESFRKFKGDLEAGFKDIGDKLNKAFDPENIKRSFGPLVAAFNAFGDSVSHYFSDPSNIVSFLCICMTSLGSVLPPPISNALGALAAVTQMIGDAALGKPFDPSNLLDLAQAFVVPPAARLAGKIATTTSKAATVLGRVKAGATAVQKAVVKDAKTAISNIAKMSAKDKAVLVGKTVFKIGGKVAGSQGPVTSQETPEQIHQDDEVEIDWGNIQMDPDAQERADELNDQINQDYEQQAMELQKDVVGMPVKQAEMDKIANATNIRTNAIVSQSVDDWLADAESNPKKYAKDEKAWLYKTKKMDEIQAVRDAKVAKSQEEAQKKLLADNELAVKKGEKTAEQGRQFAEKIKFKGENEKRKYGLTFEEALAKISLTDMELKLEALGPKYCPMTQKDQEDPQGWAERNPTCQFGVVFSEGGDNDYTVDNTSYTGGAFNENSLQATLQAENIKVDRGENAPGNDQHLYIFPAIEFPTFTQFLLRQAKANVYPIKVRQYLGSPAALPDKPALPNPEDWFKTYNKYSTLVHKMMDDYKNLIDANTAAVTARNTEDNVRRAINTVQPPEPPTPDEIQQILDNKIMDFRRSHGNNTPEEWNNLIDTFYSMYPEQPPGEGTAEWQNFSGGLTEPIKVDMGQFTGGRKGKKVRKRGGVIVRPDEKDAGKYYMDLMKKENPKITPTYENAQVRFEQDFKADPASTTANITAFMAQFPTPIKGGDGEVEIDWDNISMDSPAETANAVQDYLERNKERVNDAVTRKTLDDFGHTLYTDWLPNALQDYLHAEASEKRAKRAKVLAYIDYANIQYDPMPDALKEDAMTWNQTVLDEAPELIDMGDDLPPKESWETTDEGKVEVEQLNKADADIEATVAATEAQKQQAQEIAGQTETERRNYEQWKSEFDDAFKTAQTEDERTQAIQTFNDHFAPDDVRRLSGSGKHAPTLVMGNLWIGNHRDAVNEKWLKKHKIHAVFNITPKEPFANLPIKKYRFDIDDDPKETGRMTKMGPEVAEKVMEAIAEGPVLIHCVEGRQRSATIAALCMAIQRGGKHKTVMKRLQHKRPLCFTPTATFEASLKKWLG